MPLTLGNSITGTVSREIGAANTKLSVLAKSLTTGNNCDVNVIDGYLGSSINDSEIILSSLTQAASYAKNVVAITERSLESIASLLQKGMITITTASTLSKDKVAVLQKNIYDTRKQIDLLINNAQFDGRLLLGGQAQDIEVQIGPNITDKLNIYVRDISDSKLFRTSINKALNDWIAADSTAVRSPKYANAKELATAIRNNENLMFASVDPTVPTVGSGPEMDVALLGNTVKAVRDLYPKLFHGLNKALPQLEQELNTMYVTIETASAAQLGHALDQAGPQVEFFSYLNQTDTKIDTQANRLIALDVFTSALNEIRAEQASLHNQKQNLAKSIDALQTISNITKKTGDSYLKTDYTLATQEYSQLIHNLTASITTQQAADKIAEAALRLTESLAK